MGVGCSCLSPRGEEDASLSHFGRHVNRHFKIRKVLGRGSWGVVYAVERLSDGRRYALKETNMASLSTNLKAMAVNEVRLLASLEPHAHVVHCLEGFMDGQHLCIVMELLPGGELFDVIQRHLERGVLMEEERIWSYFIQIARGLSFLHAHGILHRDIKPQNVLLDSGGRVKIADLGVAHVVEGSTRYRIGTPHFMAPEVWRREPYAFAADIWALGCLLHEMCTRRPLFLADGEGAIEAKVLAGVVPPISRRYSQELRDLVTSLLQYYPGDRPTIEEVLALPAVQSRMAALADQSLFCMDGVELERVGSKPLLDPIEIPADLALLNLRLPEARYESGEGLVSVLRAESMPEDVLPQPEQLLQQPQTPTQQGEQQQPQLQEGQERGQEDAVASPTATAAAAVLAPGGSGRGRNSLGLRSADSGALSSRGSGALSVADSAFDGLGGYSAFAAAARK